MANTTEELIHQMYDTQLASQKEQLTNNFNTANSELDVQKQKNQKAADTNLNRTSVESQKATVNDAEYYAAAGLTSGARAQARLARENQLQSNLTAIRTAQQEADAETERQRGLLAQEYASAIRKAQADNDFQRAQALYEEAKQQEARLLQQQIAAADILGAAGDFSLHGAAYGMTEDQTAGLKAEFTQRENEAASEKAQLEQAARAEILASMGDFSGYANLYGITPEQAAAMQGKYDSEAAKAAADTAEAEKQAILEAAAELMAKGGDFSRLGALYGLTEEEIALLNSLYASGTGSNTRTGDDTGTDGDTGTGDVPGDPWTDPTYYDNEGLKEAQIKEMQEFFKVDADGLWGGQSKTAAGGKTAKEAWDYYQQVKGDTGSWEKRTGEIYDWLMGYVEGTEKVPAGYDLDRLIEVTSFLTSKEEKEYAREVLRYLMTLPNANPKQNTKPGGQPTSWIVK